MNPDGVVFTDEAAADLEDLAALSPRFEGCHARIGAVSQRHDVYPLVSPGYFIQARLGRRPPARASDINVGRRLAARQQNR
jgi:hypothetical protein